MTLQQVCSYRFKKDGANQNERNRRQRPQGHMGHDAMLQQHLVCPLAVNACELLLGLDAVIVDAEKLALFPSLLQAGELGCFGASLLPAAMTGGRGSRAGVGLRFEGIVLQGQTGCVRLRLLHGLLDQLITAALAAPRLHAAGKRAILPGRENSHLAVAARLGIRLAHGRLVRRKLLLDPGAHVARCSGQIVLGIVQLILIKVELCLGNFQVVSLQHCAAAGVRASNSAPGPDPLWPSPAVAPPSGKARWLRPWVRGRCSLAWRNDCGKGLVHLVIGQAFGLVRILLLFLADGEGGERLGNLPGVQVDDGRLAGGCQIALRFLAFEERQMGHRVPRGPGKREAHGQQAEQDEKREKPTPAEHALQRSVLLRLGSGQVGCHGQFWQVTQVAG